MANDLPPIPIKLEGNVNRLKIPFYIQGKVSIYIAKESSNKALPQGSHVIDVEPYDTIDILIDFKS